MIVGKHENGLKKNTKINNQSFTVSHPIKNNNNVLVSSTYEKLKSLTFSL